VIDASTTGDRILDRRSSCRRHHSRRSPEHPTLDLVCRQKNRRCHCDSQHLGISNGTLHHDCNTAGLRLPICFPKITIIQQIFQLMIHQAASQISTLELNQIRSQKQLSFEKLREI
jgi:hypothetical protein